MPLNLRYATFEIIYPCVFDDREGWVLLDPGWTKIHIAEVMMTAKAKTKAQFDELFPHLPALLKAAFHCDRQNPLESSSVKRWLEGELGRRDR